MSKTRKNKKFYAVGVGHSPGIYETWEECSVQVTGFPGAKFKGFATREQAQEFLHGFTSATALRPSMKRKRTEDNEEGDGSEEGTEVPAQRQTKLITSPFFSSAKDDGESAADLRDKKRLCSTRSSAIAAKSTPLAKFFEANSLQSKKWVDKDWIVANWK